MRKIIKNFMHSRIIEFNDFNKIAKLFIAFVEVNAFTSNPQIIDKIVIL